MRKLALSFSAGLIALASIASPAFAENGGRGSNVGSGGISVNKNDLPRGDQFPKGRRQIQIVDENPEIHDVRPPLEGPNNMIINIPPRKVAPGQTMIIGDPSNGGGSGAVQIPIKGNDLPQAGFQKYYKQNQVNPGLQKGDSTGVHGPTGPMALPATSQQGHKAVSGSMQTKNQQAGTVPATYPKYEQTGAINTGSFSGKGKVTGVLKSRLFDKK